jgi:threonine aldolase
METNPSSKPKLTEKEILELQYNCTRFLSGHYRQRQKPQQVLSELAELAGPDTLPDMYAQGAVIEEFEKEVAALLGKEAAVFMPSGTMCQSIALQIWSERRGTKNVAFHPTCHLELHEEKAYQMLYGLHGVLVGSPNALITLKDLKKIREPLAALLLELPQREIGGQLPTWEELQAIIEWARAQNIPLHLDGARLWECKPFYQREYAEIAGLFDSVYVSFYKILGGIAGSILAGPADFIAEARLWQHRQGGRVVRLYPYVLSARQGMQERLGKIESYCQKAQEIGTILREFPRIALRPNPPQTNMMHVYLEGDKARLEAAVLRIAKELKTWLAFPLRATELPNYYSFELTVGDAALDLSNADIARVFQTLFEWAE